MPPAVPTTRPLKSPSPESELIATNDFPKIPLNRPARTATFESTTAVVKPSPEVPTTRPTHATPDSTPELTHDQQDEETPLPKIPATRPIRASPSPVSSQPRVPATRPVRPASVDPLPKKTEAVIEQPKIPTNRPVHETNEQLVKENSSGSEAFVSGSDDKTENSPVLVAPTPIIAQSNLENATSVEETVEMTIPQNDDSPGISTSAISLNSTGESNSVEKEIVSVIEAVPELATPSIPSTRPVKVSPPIESSDIEEEVVLTAKSELATPVVPSLPVKTAAPVQNFNSEHELEKEESIIENMKTVPPVVSFRSDNASSDNASSDKINELKGTKQEDIHITANPLETKQDSKLPSVPSQRPLRVVPAEPAESDKIVKVSEEVVEKDFNEVEKHDVSKNNVVKIIEPEKLDSTTDVSESQLVSETRNENTETITTDKNHENIIGEHMEERPQVPSARPSRSLETKVPEVPVRPATRPKPTRPPSSENAKTLPPVPAHKPLPPGGVPPRPKKLSSAAAMFERQATSPPAAPTKPKPPVKLNKVGALRASLFKDLDTMISRGGIPPPMGFPKPAVEPEISEDKSANVAKEDTLSKDEGKKLTDVRRGRAKGPKRKLPSAATKSLVADTAAPIGTAVTFKLEGFVGGDVWSVGGRNLEISQKEEKERLQKLEEERLRKEEEERLKKEEEERLKKEEEERLKKEEEERLKKEEEERLKKEEEERLKKEEEEQLRKDKEERLKREEEETQLAVEKEIIKRGDENSKEEENQKTVVPKPIEEEVKTKEHSDTSLGEVESFESTKKSAAVSKAKEIEDELTSAIKSTAAIKNSDSKIKSLESLASLESTQPSLITTETRLDEESLNIKSETITTGTSSISKSENGDSVEESDSEVEILESAPAAKPVTIDLEESEVIPIDAFKADRVMKPVKDEVSDTSLKDTVISSDIEPIKSAPLLKNDGNSDSGYE